MRVSTTLFLVAVPLCTVALVGSAILVRGIGHGIDDAYAEWGAADMVIGYMEAHDGKWPRSWEELRPAFDAGGGRVGGWSFEEYRSRIKIDFTADPTELRRQALSADDPTFDVVGSTLNSGTHFEDDPNWILYRYFRSHADDREASRLELGIDDSPMFRN